MPPLTIPLLLLAAFLAMLWAMCRVAGNADRRMEEWDVERERTN